MKTNSLTLKTTTQSYELFFEPNELPRIQYFLETKQFGNLSRLNQLNQTNTGIKVEFEVRDKQTSVQIFEYLLFSYVPVSPVMIFRNKEAKALSGVITLQK